MSLDLKILRTYSKLKIAYVRIMLSEILRFGD